MDKEEFEQLKSTVKQWLFHTGSLDPTDYVNELKLKFIEPREKRIAELEEKISVLLSCKNCPENKDGLICQKEYEGKCLAQKIQYIKGLKEENAELKADNDARKFAMAMSEKVEKQLREENAELKEKLGDAQMQKAGEKSNLVWKLKTANEQKADQLTKAKEIIKNLMVFAEIDSREYEENYKEAEQFLKEVGECL